MLFMASYQKFIFYLEREEYQNFLLIAHERPDGDTIAASLAMRQLLESLGKKVVAVCSQGVPEVFQFLAGWRKIKTDFLLGDFQMIILIDNGDLRRTGFLDRIMLAKSQGLLIVNIDHHPKNDIWKLAKINIINEKVSSTCEIIYDLFKKLGKPINSHLATTLLAGMYTDTGGFQHSNTGAETLKIFSELLSSGAQLKKISNSVSNYKSLAMLKLWGIALDRIEHRPDLKLVYCVITRRDIDKVSASDQDLAGVVNLISTIPGDQASLLLYELPDGKIKGSLRTESNKVDVARIAGLFGGGGHKKAAGFVIDGRFEKVDGNWKIV